MRIGILGGGQLGRMLALSGYPLGFSFRFLDPSPEACAGQVGELLVGDYRDEVLLRRFAEGLDVVTYEFENVPAEAARFLAQSLPVYPPPKALRVAQDRLVEKRFFSSLGIPTPAFCTVEGPEDLPPAVERLGLPALLKTRRGGYDGKGQIPLQTPEDLKPVSETLDGAHLLLEQFVPFERELSVVAVRAASGEVAFYPLVENHHREGILRLSLAPAPGLTPELQAKAETYARRVLEAMGYVGVIAIEFFQVGEELLANEMAPRVHNSGHWTIEGAQTSQFQNHLRAICGLPLGPTAPRGWSAMVNLIGRAPDFRRLLAFPQAHLHWYGKQVRPDRKVGHVTLQADSEDTLRELLPRLLDLVGERLPGPYRMASSR
ncbi:MAG: 5-(carboxyamino)imidazole ribonucleotide synthase [Armatimonadota bacterium]|nr:5-(carboxyamino)imidazole ribonucleotide synthase [Armatimonadota bacterium]MDR7439675.1 5-(carboxyamino)imidazole ribonucleotide synthase [Armatimonadota bacterium]MDR7567817.1 5-(carboxyamino)imidazole ribonucleotide synthase [Armatimonadota bacterium]MDR7602140.1 5-(carboxyamino)imidazole ribonucleotide synthase [Armatimonadota bacterium]